MHAGFQADGFVHLRGWLVGDELAELHRELSRFLAEVVPSMPQAQVYCDDPTDPASLKQVQRMGEHDRWFAALQERHRPLAEELLGEPVRARNLQYLDKPAGTNLPTPLHQDGAYFALEPNHAVTLWLALDDVDEGSGCVRYLRGSHRGGLVPHAPSGVLGFSRGATVEPGGEEAACPCQAGDLLAHHSLTLHRADANRAAPRRRALGLIFDAAAARLDAGREAAYQAALDGALAAQGRLQGP